MAETGTKHPNFPLFRKYTVEELYELTGYSESHLLNVKLGWREANGAFRRKMAANLRKTEAELFGQAVDA